MPFICLRRTDLPTSSLQVLDLKPNTSQRNLVYDPPGQTKYVSYRPQTDTVATTGAGPITTTIDAQGLAAYAIDHVQAGGLSGGVLALTATQANAVSTALIVRLDGGLALTLAAVNAVLAGVVANTDLLAGTQATATVTVASYGDVSNGDTVTIEGNAFTVAAAPGVDEFAAGANANDTATNLAAAINLATNSLVGIVTAVAVLNVVTLTAVVPGSAGDAFTLATDDAVAFTVSGAIFGGSTGSGSTGNLDELLRIVAGEEYSLLSGSTVEDSGNAMEQTISGSFAPVSRILRTQTTGAFTLSVNQGRLSVMKGATFTYLGTTGAAVTIYADDGSVL